LRAHQRSYEASKASFKQVSRRPILGLGPLTTYYLLQTLQNSRPPVAQPPKPFIGVAHSF
ncbi:MAG: hypothetical protein ACK56F_05070, partial [bacterium]